jgi:DNA gyrase subunit A
MATSSERLVPVTLEEEMRSSYLDYSMSVIVSRALPDVRDGLKPVHRRVLFAMSELSLAHNRPYKKSARIVGETMGKYHPHGDSSIYDTLVRMAQEFSMRHQLVDGQGNFGSVDGDPAAAMRYTEARLTSIAGELLRDIDKNTVDFVPNFDDSLQQPSVLPASVPNLLINGSSGIAVGMATNIPPHNLREIVDGLVAMIAEPEITNDELMNYVKAPDFPTGGIIYGFDGVADAFRTGRGRVVMRARVSTEVLKSGKEQLVISELPYQVNKANLIEKIAHLVRDKKLEDISNIRDESDRDGLRVVIELKRDATPEVVMNNLYKYTALQQTFGVILLALVDGRPRVLTLRDMMYYFLEHRNTVVVRRTKFDLDAAERRAHILEGYIIALDNIDAVIALIRKSKDADTARKGLMANFKLSEIQAKAILDMRLQRLTGLERQKIEDEYREIIKLIEDLRSILDSKERQMFIIKEELLALKEKYGEPRRTDVIYDYKDFTLEELIAQEDVVVTISHNNFIKRFPVSGYRRQIRGGKGVTGMQTREDDFIEHVFVGSTHNYLVFFTDRGRCFRLKIYEIPEAGRAAKGRSLANLLPKEKDENITAILAVKDFSLDQSIIMVTEQGTVKKTALSDFANIRSTGIIAINLSKGDSLVATRLTDGDNDILIATRSGMAVRFRESDVRDMGRTAAGVRGIRLEADDRVIEMVAVKRADSNLLVVSENGYGKRSQVGDFRLTKRGGKGVISMNTTDKVGKVVAMKEVVDGDDIVVMTEGGMVIRQHVAEIRVLGRNTQGVKLIRLNANDRITGVAVVPAEDDDDEAIEGIEGEEETNGADSPDNGGSTANGTEPTE